MFNSKMLVAVLAVCALSAGSALAVSAVPVFTFDAGTGQMTVDTQGLTLETIIITGPGTDGVESTSGRGPLFDGFQPTGGGVTGTHSMLWAFVYSSGQIQSFDQIGDPENPGQEGINTDFHGFAPVLYLTYTGGVTLADFPAGGVEVFSFEQDIETFSVTAVPEPATMSLLGLGGLALLRRKKQR